MYRLCQNVRMEKFMVFTVFLLNCESFPVNHGLVDQQYKTSIILRQKFFVNSHYLLKTQMFSPVDILPYAVYAMGDHL